jgi:transmembrane sensor
VTVAQTEPLDAVYEEAAAWVLRLAGRDEDSALRETFEAWRDASPDHARAFADAQASWTLLQDEAASPELLARRRDALGRARRAGRRRWNGAPDRRMLAAGLAAGLAAAIAVPLGAFWWIRTRPPAPELFETGHGEQRTIVLSDGSRMSLDALTRVRVAYTGDLRSIDLVAGRANFEVAKDIARPMKVHAAGRTVTALGTVFCVEQQAHGVVVSLVEGRVAVSGAGAAPIEMSPRQQLTVADGAQPSLRIVDPEQALAWREGKLIFDDEPLGLAAARMNNYGAPVLVVDASAQSLRISGVFRAGDTGAFVEALELYFPITAEQAGGSITIRLRSPGQRL